MSKRAIWLAEVGLIAMGVILALHGKYTEVVAIAGFIAATLDKLVSRD